MNLRKTGNRRHQWGSKNRGSSAVEAAIVTPMVFALFFGIVELGFLFKDYLAVAGAVRAGVRIASANPRTSTFAQVAAADVALTGGAMNFNDILQLWVYKVSTTATSDKPYGRTDFNDCDVCVQFRWDAPTQTFVTTSNAAHPGLKDNWPYTTQNACSARGPGGPPDRIGVYIKLKHDAFTNFVFNTVTISEASVMTLEPMPVLTVCK
jgi:Flp pilus assembly protein TadG